MVAIANIKQLIDDGARLIHKIHSINDSNIRSMVLNEEYSEQQFTKMSDSQLSEIMPIVLPWCERGREITIKWFKETFKKAKDNIDIDYFGNEMNWLVDEHKRINLAVLKWKNTDKEKKSRTSPKNGLQMEVLNNPKLNGKESRNRLTGLLTAAYSLENNYQELLKYTQNLVNQESEIFEYLIDSKQRQLVFRLKNINHITESILQPDSRSQQKLSDDLAKLLGVKGVEKQIKNVTNLLIIMTLFIDLQEKAASAPKKYVNDWMERFDRKIADNSYAVRSEGILRKIDQLKWGPKDYKRDPSVIKRAEGILKKNGILTLTGVGAVGKTALANYLTREAAVIDEYDFYIVKTSKIGSSQWELAPDEPGQKAKPNDTITLGESMRRDDGSIIGSLKSICERILVFQDSDFDIKNYTEPEYIGRAIEAMQESSYLITIDNFEDIEDPDLKDYSKEVRSEINQELNRFKRFFAEWSRTYKPELDKASRIIITTRGKGEDTQTNIMPVPPLSLQENLTLFKNKLIARRKDGIIDDNVLVYATADIAQLVEEEFKNWNSPNVKFESSEFPAKEYNFQPAYTIFAACGIRSTDDLNHGVLAQIKRWNPEGKDAEFIRKYVTEKVFGGITEEEINMFAKLLARGRNFRFDIEGIMTLSHTLPNDYESWAYATANKFIIEYEGHRDFFVEKKRGDYGWTPFYFQEILEHFKTKNADLLNDELLQYQRTRTDDEKEFEDVTPIIYNNERRALMMWISQGLPQTSISGEERTFNSSIKNLVKEANLPDEKILQALVMVIGNRNLKIPEKIHQSLFGTTAPESNIFEILRTNTKVKKGKSNKRGKDTLKETSATNFVENNIGYVWRYFMNIHHQFSQSCIREKNPEAMLTLYDRIYEDVESYRTTQHISVFDVLLFYKSMISGFNELKNHFDTSEIKDFESISEKLLNRYINHLNVIPEPNTLSFDLSINQLVDSNTESNIARNAGHFDYYNMTKTNLDELAKTRNIKGYNTMKVNDLINELDKTNLIQHYKTIIMFVNEYIDYNGNREELLGKVFWTAIRYLASLSSSDSIDITELNDLYTKLSLYSGPGAKIAGMNINLVEQKIQRVRSNFEQVTWNLEEITNSITLTYGGLRGKLVLYESENPEKYRHLNRDIKIFNESDDEKTTIYSIQHIDNSTIYLYPHLSKDGELLNNNDNTSNINDLREKIIQHLKNLSKQMNTAILWQEFKQKIPHKDMFIDLDKGSEETQFNYFRDVVVNKQNLEELKLKIFITESRQLYIKFRDFSPTEREKLQIYSWEKIPNINEYCIAAITRKTQDDGFGLPKNPNDISIFAETILTLDKNSHTWRDFIERVKRDHARFEPHQIERFASVVYGSFNSISGKNRPPGWRREQIKLPNRIEEKDLIKLLHEKCIATSTYLMNNQKERYQNIRDVVDQYFLKIAFFN